MILNVLNPAKAKRAGSPALAAPSCAFSSCSLSSNARVVASARPQQRHAQIPDALAWRYTHCHSTCTHLRGVDASRAPPPPPSSAERERLG